LGSRKGVGEGAEAVVSAMVETFFFFLFWRYRDTKRPVA
jgi:hypothetical protein